MITVQGKQLAEMTRPQLRAIAADHTGVTVDVGTGDGAFALRYARAHPERYVIGLDPVRENMRESSARAARKPERGGTPNALFVVASIERLPEELHGIADEIFVTLPWGSLMRGIIMATGDVMSGLASLARNGASLRIVLNTRIFDDPVPIEVAYLPELTPEYARSVLHLAYAAHGIDITDARTMPADEVATLDTTWAKRLSHRTPPPSVLIEARIEPRR